MSTQIKKNGKIYYIETGYGFNPDKSTVICYNGVDEFGRLIDGKCVYMGPWDKCIEYVESL